MVKHTSDAQAKESLQQGFVYLSAEGKGVGCKDAAVFTSGDVPLDFGKKWLASEDRNLRIADAWHKTLGTKDVWEEKPGNERQHYRLMLSPDAAFWRRNKLKARSEQAEAMEIATKRTIQLLELATELEFIWTASVHVNTKQTHAHVLIRGRDMKGRSMWLPPKRRVRHLARQALFELQMSIKAAREVANVS